MNVLGRELKCIVWELSVNEHKTCYADAKEYYDIDDGLGLECNIDFSKDIYCLTYYPSTPVGHINLYSNTYEGILELLDKEIEEY